ncbi:hypothetical protein [Rhodococcus sp. JVH1]|uniref:hypothetical protein n=1 Tax=Rhodococcus sp. JVH1 TaxID=745408 RepID=UPI000271E045|nr:hypothetical protein [Rhodococcus sp. JVH1]EJI98686.1 hypothetical protein JVH1_3810 [Rhodococcus sp. JVH1]
MTSSTYSDPPTNDPRHQHRTALIEHREQLSRARWIAVVFPLLVLTVLSGFFADTLTPWLPLACPLALAVGIAAAVMIGQLLHTVEQMLAPAPTTSAVSMGTFRKDHRQ